MKTIRDKWQRVLQRFIAWLLERYTPFHVVAWNYDRISGISCDAEIRQTFADWNKQALQRKRQFFPEYLGHNYFAR